MNSFNNNITALIMVGGQSKRMGGISKSLLFINKKNIFERILERLQNQTNNIIINSNIEKDKFIKYQLPIISDLKTGYLGPLAGIHSAMNWLIKNKPKNEWLITIPGDTPFIPLDIVSKFEKKTLNKKKIILAKSNKKIHPIIGAWHISLYENLDKHLELGTRKILTWTNNHPIDFINYTNKPLDPFFNINTKEDLKKACLLERDQNFFKKY